MVVGARSIRSEKLKELQYREGYARSHKGKGIEWDGEYKVEQMKPVMVESSREVCDSVRAGGKNQKNDGVKAKLRRKEVLTATDK